jgi:hypothetical protein
LFAKSRAWFNLQGGATALPISTKFETGKTFRKIVGQLPPILPLERGKTPFGEVRESVQDVISK